jgi:hypothetical protein
MIPGSVAVVSVSVVPRPAPPALGVVGDPRVVLYSEPLSAGVAARGSAFWGLSHRGAVVAVGFKFGSGAPGFFAVDHVFAGL